MKPANPYFPSEVAEHLFKNKSSGVYYEKSLNVISSKNIKFDLNYGVAYCNGQIAFRVVSGTPVIVENLLGSEKELKIIRKILEKLNIRAKEVSCKYGLSRINEEIRDLIVKKNARKPGENTILERTKLNNQIAFLRHIGALCSLQDEIDNEKSFDVNRDKDNSTLIEEFVETNAKKERTNITKIKKLIGI